MSSTEINIDLLMTPAAGRGDPKALGFDALRASARLALKLR